MIKHENYYTADELLHQSEETQSNVRSAISRLQSKTIYDEELYRGIDFLLSLHPNDEMLKRRQREIKAFTRVSTQSIDRTSSTGRIYTKGEQQ